ncbi:hypothetical protein [Seonamhaeicola sp. ML3]|uniref:hypothetical protein n=1 Tax=Seonamhaeicola sp. ML3 TaxID=2937786 RepID=UPI00200CA486|nr:hypothetical protein [Seonamhaeicola sp. ML3]
MKNLRLIILGFIIGALATYFFCPRQAVEEEAVVAKIVKPKGVITVAQAKELNDNWTKFRKPVLDSITQQMVGKDDYRSAWWSLKDVEDYIAYIKQETQNDGETFTGLRVYFGVYGESISADKKDLSTIFIVPTGSKIVEKASMVNFNLQGGDGDLPKPPLNDGNGGGGYPQ